MGCPKVELLRDEACRLLRVKIDLLQRMQAAEGVVVDDHTDEQQTFSRNGIRGEIDILQGELQKVSELRMVLAVVGTMKAGKSTTINAIVGNEVLPNRNRPMTALPTLIEHTPGQLEPVLELKNCKPINQLLDRLNQVVHTPQGQAGLQELEQTRDMDELLTLIYGRGRFKDLYNGSEKIFWFLKSLNDLVRLSALLKVEFPFASYASIDDYPVIKVQFAHLGNSDSHGRLALLDTPGPNEAGQQHLRKMLREQLQKASAVMAVMDFTQLKSDADEQVREYIEEVAEVSNGRLFAIVNKFDQKDRNGDNEEQTRSFVAESLLKGSVPSSNVYPVSSRQGYLASRAKHELALNGRLPDHKLAGNGWVGDFAERVLGPDWEEEIDEIERIAKKADRLWEKSRFEEPLERLIRKANDQAAVMALSSAAAKLLNTSKRLRSFLEVRNKALKISVGELQAQIESLCSDVEKVDRLAEQSESDSEKVIAGVRKGMERDFDAIRTDINRKIEEGFKAGKRQELQAAKRNHANEIGSSGFLKGRLLAALGKQSNRAGTGFGFEYDERNPVINFDSEKDAKKLVSDIEQGVQGVIAKGEAILVQRMRQTLQTFRSAFEVDVEESAKAIINNLNQRLKGSGFSIALDIPDVAPLALSYSAGEVLRDAVDSKQRSVPKSRRSTGVWGTLCKWCNSSDWGWETYMVDEGYYAVDINKLHDTVKNSIDALFRGLDTAATQTIEIPLKESVNAFFEQLVGSIKAIRSDLQQSIRDQKRSQADQQALSLLLTSFQRDLSPVQKDSAGLLKDVEPLSAEAAA